MLKIKNSCIKVEHGVLVSPNLIKFNITLCIIIINYTVIKDREVISCVLDHCFQTAGCVACLGSEINLGGCNHFILKINQNRI